MCLGGSKNLCLYRCSGSSGALGFQNPMFFKGLLAPRRPWGLHCFCRFFFVSLLALEAPKPLCFQRCSGSQKFCVFHRLLDPRGAWELQKSMLSQIFGLLGGPGGLQTLSFHKYPGSSGALGLQNPMSKMFWLLGCPGGSQILCFTGVRAPQVTSGTPKPNVFMSFFWLLGAPGASNIMHFHRFYGS